MLPVVPENITALARLAGAHDVDRQLFCDLLEIILDRTRDKKPTVPSVRDRFLVPALCKLFAEFQSSDALVELGKVRALRGTVLDAACEFVYAALDAAAVAVHPKLLRRRASDKYLRQIVREHLYALGVRRRSSAHGNLRDGEPGPEDFPNWYYDLDLQDRLVVRWAKLGFDYDPVLGVARPFAPVSGRSRE